MKHWFSKSQSLTFKKPIIISFLALLLWFTALASYLYTDQRNEILNTHHYQNTKFIHNFSVSYLRSIFSTSELVMNSTVKLLSNNNLTDQLVNKEPKDGVQFLMNLLAVLPNVYSVSLSDSAGNYIRAPKLIIPGTDRNFVPKSRPWFINQFELSNDVHYTNVYKDFFTHTSTVTISKAIISSSGDIVGTLAFHLDLPLISSSLRQLLTPLPGDFFVVNLQGEIMLHQNTNSINKKSLDISLIKKMSNGEGEFYDEQNHIWYYYYSLVKPDWVSIYRVSDEDLKFEMNHITTIVVWGFLSTSIIIILFGMYLYLSSRTVLMNIINAIKTGDVKSPLGLEALLSNVIKNNKEREISYVKKATIDALTGCKNRGSFNEDINMLITAFKPFSLALLDIDNFKSINDRWGHLTGDIVLRNVARVGLEILTPLGLHLYRYGGEEFAIIFDDTSKKPIDILEDFRLKVEKRTWREENLNVTFSAGFGEWNMDSLEQLILRIDDALYEAKKNGKNKIHLT